MQTTSLKELMEKVEKDCTIALFLIGNPDRIKVIENAMNEVIKEKGWDDKKE